MTGPGVDTQMQARAALATDPAGLQDLARGARAGDAQAVEAVAREFEAMLIGQMLKQMREASLGEGLFENDQTKMYREMMDQEVARTMSQGEGIGLRDLLMNQLADTQTAPRAEPDNPERAAPLAVPHRRPELDTVQALRSASEAEPGPEGPEQAAAPNEMVSSRTEPVAWPPHDARDFVETLEPMARQAAVELGVSPVILLAQSALETGWGRHLPSTADGQPSFNLFGIKADSRWSGDQVTVPTLEFRDGVPQREQARFRAYGEPADAFADYVELIRNNPRYHRALAAGNDAAYIRELQEAGYATDPAYTDKVLHLRDQVAGYRDSDPPQVSVAPAVTRSRG